MDSIKSPFLILYIFFFDGRGGKMGSIQRNVEKKIFLFLGRKVVFMKFNVPVVIASDNMSIL